MNKEQVFRLPLPPSTNELTKNVDRPTGDVRAAISAPKSGKHKPRVKTAKYKAWLTAAGYRLNLLRLKPIVGWVTVRILVPESMRGDLDNRLKASLDLLVTHHVISDDRKIWDLRITRVSGLEPLDEMMVFLS